VLDGTVVLLLVLAVCVFAFGGFREYVGPLRVSVRSADRLVVLATLLLLVRHVLVPSPRITTSLRNSFSRIWSSEARLTVLPAFTATRLSVIVVGYLAVVTIGIPAGMARFSVSEHAFENLFARWDAFWYMSIASQGYQWDGNPLREQNVVFFPLYPAAMRAVGLFLGQRWLLAGVVVSMAAFLAALAYVYRLACDLLDPVRARSVVWTLASYPFAIYFSAPYTESIYLLGSVAMFFHLSRAEWGRATAWGLVVGLSRPNGFFLAQPAAIILVQHAVARRRLPWRGAIACVAPVVGVLAYSAFLYVKFGDALAWMQGQAAWGRVYVGIGPALYALVFDRYDVIAEQGFYHYTATNPYDFVHSIAAILILASIWPCTRRFGLAYGAFVAINIVPPLLMGGMMSIGRMTSVLFPMFLWLGALLSPRYLPAWIAASCVLQGLIAILFFTWRPVF
jgi:hypothetical protein